MSTSSGIYATIRHMAETLRLDALIRVSAEAGRGDHLRSPEQQLAMCDQAAPAVDGVIVNRDAPPPSTSAAGRWIVPT